MKQITNKKVSISAFVGFLLIIVDGQVAAEQLTLSNAWTLPQNGFTVFYRFFRDKISWYEADAVCQFHHANLVTVDNDVKYDASRAFLSDLNTTENVWIGLMRSENSDRFLWSNSRILDREFGYWAEQIPLIESPLCAVIDPLRDYRWHSFHCGGPEVASFLCEIEVPDWASDCIVRDLQSITIQYLSDSATIELFRDCSFEGVKRLTCSGKQDQEHIRRELICKSEQVNSDTDDLNALNTGTLHIFGNTPSDNSENNNIYQFADKNQSELMMGDQAFENKHYSLNVRKGEAENVKIMSKAIQNENGTLVVERITDSSTKTALNSEARSRRETESPALSKIDNATASTEPSSNVNSYKNDVNNSSNSQDHFLLPMVLIHYDNSEKPSDITNITSEAIQSTKDPTLLYGSISNTSSSVQEIPISIDIEQATELTTIPTVSTKNGYPKSKWGRPHAPKFGGEISFHAPILASMRATIELITETGDSVNVKLNSTFSTSIPGNLKMNNEISTIQTSPEIFDASKSSPIIDEATTIEVDTVEIEKRSNGIPVPNKYQHKDGENGNIEANQHADFTNSNVDLQRLKPNRHRILTKPETHTYIQKIFG